jgi:hypothetical protein
VLEFDGQQTPVNLAEGENVKITVPLIATPLRLVRLGGAAICRHYADHADCRPME